MLKQKRTGGVAQALEHLRDSLDQGWQAHVSGDQVLDVGEQWVCGVGQGHSCLGSVWPRDNRLPGCLFLREAKKPD
jgi:hypothetical protein